MSSILLVQEEEAKITIGAMPDVFQSMFAATTDRTGVGDGPNRQLSDRLFNWWLSRPGTVPVWHSTDMYWVSFTSINQDAWGVLQIAAEARDEVTFLRAIWQIPWSAQSSSDFMHAVRLALEVGAHMVARRLADYGSRLFPANKELVQMAHILAPPKVVAVRKRQSGVNKANQQWLRQHQTKYRGMWVVLSNGELLAAANTVQELKAQQIDFSNVMVTRA